MQIRKRVIIYIKTSAEVVALRALLPDGSVRTFSEAPAIAYNQETRKVVAWGTKALAYEWQSASNAPVVCVKLFGHPRLAICDWDETRLFLAQLLPHLLGHSANWFLHDPVFHPICIIFHPEVVGGDILTDIETRTFLQLGKALGASDTFITQNEGEVPDAEMRRITFAAKSVWNTNIS